MDVGVLFGGFLGLVGLSAVACLALDMNGYDGATGDGMNGLYRFFWIIAMCGGLAMCAVGGASQ